MKIYKNSYKTNLISFQIKKKKTFDNKNKNQNHKINKIKNIFNK